MSRIALEWLYHGGGDEFLVIFSLLRCSCSFSNCFCTNLMKSSLGLGHWESVLEQQRVSAARSGAAASRFLGAAPARVDFTVTWCSATVKSHRNGCTKALSTICLVMLFQFRV